MLYLNAIQFCYYFVKYMYEEHSITFSRLFLKAKIVLPTLLKRVKKT